MQEKLHEAVVNLTTQSVEYNVRLGQNHHANMDAEEILAAEQLAVTDEGVLAEIAKLKLPEGTRILCDPWIFGLFGPALLCLV